jgi:hypothetical protein
LLAAKLYHLGISQAESVTFIADGAPWIWDRFDWLVDVLKRSFLASEQRRDLNR